VSEFTEEMMALVAQTMTEMSRMMLGVNPPMMRMLVS
jgi:hypothetical protein